MPRFINAAARASVLRPTSLRVCRVRGAAERLHPLEHGAEVAAAARERQARDGEHDLEAPPPLGARRRSVSLGQRQVRRRPVERALGHLAVPEEQRELRTGRGLGRERGDQRGQRRVLPLEGQRQGAVDEQPGGVRPVPGGLGVPDGLGDLPVRRVPLGRGPVQRHDGVGLGAPQLEPQQVREEVVVAEPGPPGVERDDERVRRLQLVQDALRAGGADEDVGERAVHLLEDRGAEEQAAHVVGLPLQHLGQQVLGHGPLAAGELGDEPLGLRMPGEREGGQAQPGRPALGPGVEQRDTLVRQRDARRREELPRLVEREAQVRGHGSRRAARPGAGGAGPGAGHGGSPARPAAAGVGGRAGLRAARAPRPSAARAGHRGPGRPGVRARRAARRGGRRGSRPRSPASASAARSVPPPRRRRPAARRRRARTAARLARRGRRRPRRPGR